MHTSPRTAVAAVALVLATLGTVPAQNVSDGELQRYIFTAAFPGECGAARLTVNAMRTDPTTDPGRLHKDIDIFSACGTSPTASRYEGLYDLSVYTAAAAALLAARHEPPDAAASDARFALQASNIIMGVGRGPGSGIGAGALSSPLANNARLIGLDAQTLLTQPSAPASPAAAPSVIPSMPSRTPNG